MLEKRRFAIMENDALIVKEGETKFNFLMLKKICS
jgi:hypothetical protein